MRPFTDVDLAPLTASVTSTELRTFRQRQLEALRGGPHARARTRRLTFAWVCVAIIVILATGVAVRLALDPRAAASIGGPDHARVAAAAIATAIPVVALVAATILWFTSRRVWTHRFRLDAFARANDFGLVFSSGTPAYPGALFHGAPDAAAYDRLHALTGRALELGGYRYTTRFGASSGHGTGPGGYGKSMTFDAKTSRRDWGYLALQLDRSTPQIVLEAREHRGALSTTGHTVTYRRNPTLRLSGASGRTFTLYCPAGSERDALRMFGPELLALLDDPERTLDAELVDGWMFVYSPLAWDLTDPALLQRLFRIADTATATDVPATDVATSDDTGSRASAAAEGDLEHGADEASPARATDWPAERPDDLIEPAMGRFGTIVGVTALAIAVVIAVWLVVSLAVTGAR